MDSSLSFMKQDKLLQVVLGYNFPDIIRLFLCSYPKEAQGTISSGVDMKLKL